MRIAMLAPIAWRTPPRNYGPWELVTSLLTEELVSQGFDVTLFATQDSITSGVLAGVVPAPYSEDHSIDAKVWEFRHLAHLFEQAAKFDIIHNQADFPAHAFSRLVDTPIVTTIHGFSSDRILPMYKAFEDRIHFVAISDADRHPSLDYAATIHHGVDVASFPFDPVGSEDLLFFGRIHDSKGTREAIEVAHAADRRLIVHGIVQDEWYFEQQVRPRLDGVSACFRGPVGGAARSTALGSARALLHLINFEEPFGLSVIEAMACGTPVIATRRGSMPEIIEHGVNGLIVDSLDEAIDAVEHIGELDRRDVRHSVEKRFTVQQMASKYISLYNNILNKIAE